MRHTSIVARRNLVRWSIGALLAFGCTATMVAASLSLPPIVVPATRDHHPGKVIWVDLVTPDLDAAKRFYGGMFGWTFRDVSTGESDKAYVLVLLGDRPVGGLFHRAVQTGEHRHPAWLTFIAVRDVAKAEKVILASGGKVLSQPKTYPQRGRQAIFADPQGAVFAVLQSSSGDPNDFLAAPGEWIWSSLITSDPDAGAAFYQKLFAYEVFDLTSADSGDHGEHLLLATDGYARASANSLPADVPKLHAHWLNFVRVVSAKDAAAKATELGGRVLVEPHSDRHGGMIAVVADPSGAPFGLLEWSDTESKEVAK
jgi:predicted enzyme related to lactoylglutathione lyase